MLGICSTVKENEFIRDIQRAIFPTWRGWFKMCVIGELSHWMTKGKCSKDCWNFLNPKIMARPSSSMVGLLSSCLFNNRDAYATGRRSSPYFCVNWAPSPEPLASVCRTKVRSKSSAPLSCSKDCCWSGPHVNSTPFLFKTFRGREIWA